MASFLPPLHLSIPVGLRFELLIARDPFPSIVGFAGQSQVMFIVSIRRMISAGCGVIEGGSDRGRRLNESALVCFSPDRYKIV